MPQYTYRALTASGRQMRGQMQAANDVDLYQRLQQINLELVTFKEVKESGGGLASLQQLLAPRIKTRDVIQFSVQMEQLQRAGVPLLDSLQDTRDATDNPRFRDVLSDVSQAVSEGTVLSQALDQHRGVFGHVVTGVVGAGEQTGNLVDSFAHLVSHLRWQDEMNSRVKKALRYPVFMLVVMVLVMGMMMGMVVPQVTTLLQQLGQELPVITTSLIAVSDFITGNWHLIVLTPIVLFVGGFLAVRASSELAYYKDHLLLRVPILGPTIRKIALARFTHFFAVTFASGIDILNCMDTAKQVLHNKVLERSLAMARDQVQTGNNLSVALERTGEFPRLVVRMFKVGEDTGNMQGALENITYFYDREVQAAVDTLIGSIEPMLTAVVGALMGWIVLAIMLPVYNTVGSMGGM